MLSQCLPCTHFLSLLCSGEGLSFHGKKRQECKNKKVGNVVATQAVSSIICVTAQAFILLIFV